MQKITHIFFLLLLSFSLLSQDEKAKKLEHGFLLSTRINSNDNFKFNEKGYGVEGGVYYLKKLGKKHAISLDIRLAYTKDNSNPLTMIDTSWNTSPSNTYVTIRYNGLEHKEIALYLPIKYRYQISEKVPIILLIGINPYFNIGGEATWYFTQREHDAVSNEIISKSYHGKVLKQKPFGKDMFLTGLGYKNNKWLFDAYLSKGEINFDNGFNGIKSWDRFSILLNVYYRLN